MVTKNEGGQEGSRKSASVRIVAIGGYFKFERAVSLKTQYFRFRLLQLFK
jgi:hypothetical protein